MPEQAGEVTMSARVAASVKLYSLVTGPRRVRLCEGACGPSSSAAEWYNAAVDERNLVPATLPAATDHIIHRQ